MSTSASTSIYAPMTWPTGTEPVTFTWTYDSYSTNVYTTTTVIQSASTAPISTSPSSTAIPGPTTVTTSSSNQATTTVPVTPPAPTQSGITASCSDYYVVQSGDSCAAIESMFSLTFQQFYAWNPAIGSNCGNLWLGEAYCVGVFGSSTSSGSTTSTATTGAATAPAPTQSGVASGCKNYYTVESGDSCSAIESQYGISFAQFYQWNPAVGSNCQSLWVGYAYCVAV